MFSPVDVSSLVTQLAGTLSIRESVNMGPFANRALAVDASSSMRVGRRAVLELQLSKKRNPTMWQLATLNAYEVSCPLSAHQTASVSESLCRHTLQLCFEDRARPAVSVMHRGIST